MPLSLRSLLVRLVIVALTIVAAAASGTEHTSDNEGDDVTIEEVVVIGSLIKRETVFEGRAPVQALDSELFEASGAAQPVDILKALTANTGSTLATQQDYLQGTSQFSLRGLGLSSTLTLINGRRAGLAPVSNDVGHSFFDINTLPVAMIERVDILRDGASSTYGSQAVAGVANIITRRQFRGFEVTGGYRDSSNHAYDLSFASGFATSSGRINVYGSHYRQDENFRTDFSWMIPRAIDPDGDGNIVEGSFDSGRGSPGSFRRAVMNADGTFAPFKVNGIDAPRQPDPDCQAGGGYPSGSLCRMDFSDQRTMIAAEERLQLFSDSEIDATDRLTLFAEIGYSANNVTDRVGNMLLFNGNVEGTNEFFVPANHPFNFWTDPDGDGNLTYVAPSDWRPEVHEAVAVSYFGRPFGAEANGDQAGFERRNYDNLRLLFGLDLEFANDWTGTGYVAHMRSDFDVAADRHWIAAEFARVVREGDWNPFGTRLVSPELVTPKTVADDNLDAGFIGKRAANDPQTLAQFNGTRIESSYTLQRVGEFVATGDLPAWLDRPMALAIGAQYRELQYAYTPDPIEEAGGGPSAIRQFAREADQNAWAIFAEHLTMISDYAEVQVALRHENYDQAGSTTDPKISALVSVSEWLSLRTSWGTSFQAPSVFQTAGNFSARTLSDPFRFDGQGAGECTVGPSGEILNRGDNFNTRTVLRGGSLRPQSAGLFNFGVLLQPTSRADVSLDYWSIDYEDVIAQGRSFQAILDDDCRDDGLPNDPRVQRDSSGQLNIVTTDFENVAGVHTEGLDLNAHVDMASSLGDFRLSADATVLTKFDVDFGSSTVEDRLGNRNDTNGFGPTPQIRLNLGLSWTRGEHFLNVSMRHIDAYKNDEVATLPEIDAWRTFDVHYAYSFLPFDRETTVYVGANNLTDNDPPGLPSGRDGILRYNLRPGFDGLVHDIKGRATYMRIRVRF